MFILPPPTPKYNMYYSSGAMFNNVRSENQSNIDATNSLIPLTSELSFTAPEGTYEARNCLTLHNPTHHPADPQPMTVNPLAPTSYLPQTYSSGVRLSVVSFKYTPPPGTLEANAQQQYQILNQGFQQQQQGLVSAQSTPSSTNSRWKPSFFGSSSSNNRRNSAVPVSSYSSPQIQTSPASFSPVIDERQPVGVCENGHNTNSLIGSSTLVNNGRLQPRPHSQSISSLPLSHSSGNPQDSSSRFPNGRKTKAPNSGSVNNYNAFDNATNGNGEFSPFVCRQPTGAIGNSIIPPNAIGSNQTLSNLHVFIPLDPSAPSSGFSGLPGLPSGSTAASTVDKKRKSKHSNLAKNSSSFISKAITHDNLSKRLGDRSLDSEPVVWVNMGRSLQWLDFSSILTETSQIPDNTSSQAAAATNSSSTPSNTHSTQITPEETLSKIFFIRSHPLCHDINLYTRSPNALDLVVGMSSGDILWLDPANNRYSRLNKNGDVTRSPVTAIKWVPGSANVLVSVHANGALVVWDKEREDGGFVKQGGLGKIGKRSTDGFRIIKSLYEESEVNDNASSNNTNNNDTQGSQKQNPVAVYKLSHKPLTSIEFSPDRQTVSITSSDGYLRFLNLATEVITDIFPSYFGGILCSAFSPDGKYLVTGGEDDLVSVWSVRKRSLVARGHGHRSWVRKVAFDAWNCETGGTGNYRVGSVGDEGDLIFWDFSAKMLSRAKAMQKGGNKNGKSGNSKDGKGSTREKRQASMSSIRNPLVPFPSNDDSSSLLLKPTLSTGGYSVNTMNTTSILTNNTSILINNSSNTNPSAAAALALAGGSTFNPNPDSTITHSFIPKFELPQLTAVAVLNVKFDFAKYCEENNNSNSNSSTDNNGNSEQSGHGSGNEKPNHSFHAEGLSDLVFLEKTVMVASKDGRIWTWNRPRSN